MERYRAVITGLLAFMAQLGALFQMDFSAAEQASLIDMAQAAWLNLSGMAVTLLAIYYRIIARFTVVEGDPLITEKKR